MSARPVTAKKARKQLTGLDRSYANFRQRLALAQSDAQRMAVAFDWLRIELQASDRSEHGVPDDLKQATAIRKRVLSVLIDAADQARRRPWIRGGR